MSKARRLASDHADAGTTVATRGQLFDLAVIQPDSGSSPIRSKNFGEISARTKSFGQNSLKNVVVNHTLSLASRLQDWLRPTQSTNTKSCQPTTHPSDDE